MPQSPLRIAGVDEAGRGPLAGPVVAAAVILDPRQPIEGLKDSKQLTEKKRQYLSQVIQEKALAFAICEASVIEIDTINILQATLLAMQRAVNNLPIAAEHVLIDGNQRPQLIQTSETIVRGDQTVSCISAASILAKVYRDNYMIQLDETYPVYGFALHKGYPTKQHLLALQQFGVTLHHRKSFEPVKRLLAQALAENE